MRKLLVIVFVFLTSSCLYISNDPLNDTKARAFESFITIQHRDVTLSSNLMEGEGLAKGVPGQPLLINNQLVFSTMGDAVLGIAIAVGAIKRSVDLFDDMAPLDMREWTQLAIEEKYGDPEWNKLSGKLASNGYNLILEPYSYLDGYPEATLETRLAVTIVDADGGQLGFQLVERAQRLPLDGAESWSENNAKKLLSAVQVALPNLIEKLPKAFAESQENQ